MVDTKIIFEVIVLTKTRREDHEENSVVVPVVLEHITLCGMCRRSKHCCTYRHLEWTYCWLLARSVARDDLADNFHHLDLLEQCELLRNSQQWHLVQLRFCTRRRHPIRRKHRSIVAKVVIAFSKTVHI